MITIATAECFTHGILAREIHALAQDYEDNFASHYLNLITAAQNDCLEDGILKGNHSLFDLKNLSVSCGLFIPTLLVRGFLCFLVGAVLKLERLIIRGSLLPTIISGVLPTSFPYVYAIAISSGTFVGVSTNCILHFASVYI